MWAALGLEFLHISIIYILHFILTALLLFVLGFKLYNLILYIFFLISSEKAVQESEGILMVCEVGRGKGGGGYDLICTSCLVVSGIVPKTVDLLPNSCDRI